MNVVYYYRRSKCQSHAVWERIKYATPNSVMLSIYLKQRARPQTLYRNGDKKSCPQNVRCGGKNQKRDISIDTYLMVIICFWRLFNTSLWMRQNKKYAMSSIKESLPRNIEPFKWNLFIFLYPADGCLQIEKEMTMWLVSFRKLCEAAK